MNNNMAANICAYGMVAFFAIIILGVIVMAVIMIRDASKAEFLVNRTTNELKQMGLLVNHSYKGVSRKDGKTIRFRIIDLSYNGKLECVVGTMYLCSKNEEIGIWKDKAEYLDSIPSEFDLTDLGTWSPAPQGID